MTLSVGCQRALFYFLNAGSHPAELCCQFIIQFSKGASKDNLVFTFTRMPRKHALWFSTSQRKLYHFRLIAYKNTYNRIQKLQRLACLRSTGAMRNTPTTALQDFLNLNPLPNQIKKAFLSAPSMNQAAKLASK